MSSDEMEQQLLAVAFKKAKDGDYNFYRDTFDRVYGRAMQPTDITSGGKPIQGNKIEFQEFNDTESK
jgi:hypothetical protein